jgi:putative phosphoesterase
MLVCILSDSHDHIPLLRSAVADAIQRGAGAVLHCGDVVAPSTLGQITGFGLPLHVIHGNNSGDMYMLGQLAQKSGGMLHYYGQDAALTLAGRRIFLVHYPHYARALAMTGEYDLVCCGHTHRPRIEKLPNMRGGETCVVNPGTVGGVGAAPSYVLGNLETLEFTVLAVPLPAALPVALPAVAPSA